MSRFDEIREEGGLLPSALSGDGESYFLPPRSENYFGGWGGNLVECVIGWNGLG